MGLFPSLHLSIKVLRRPVEFALHALIAVMDQFRQVTVITRTGPDGVLEGIQRQIGAQRAGHSPADDAAANRSITKAT
ncbi:hypothetical protein B277_16297 [Janibacter hoylei PVAS-1]|uniref:Uncharacterized protein n=1 Tax=Janibacter hoylei PVAS-1 TaxID=1210046 RepID=K1EKF4_9MICO|nr:hypothetical protein B277_16297 [Janibacter hoylei PVAS-1]